MLTNDSGKADLLEHLTIALPQYADVLNISQEDLAKLKADSICFRYTINKSNQMQSHSQHWTAFKKHLRDGGSGIVDWPVLPKLEVCPRSPALA